MAPPPRIVVKLGGSLAGSERLDRLVADIVAAKGCHVAVVSGGGLFADAIREAQRRLGFSDALAHRLALDAMDHMAELLAEREPRLVPHCGTPELASAWARGLVPIWSPREVRPGHPDIAESWAVTSDSLAVWLAARIGADRAVLVKSIDGAEGAPDVLARSGIVDAAFPHFAARFEGTIDLVGPGDDASFPTLVEGSRDHA